MKATQFKEPKSMEKKELEEALKKEETATFRKAVTGSRKTTLEKNQNNFMKNQMSRRLKPTLNWRSSIDTKAYVDTCETPKSLWENVIKRKVWLGYE